MFNWRRKGKDGLTGIELDKLQKDNGEEQKKLEKLSQEEKDAMNKIESDFADARGTREESGYTFGSNNSTVDFGWCIENDWEDEYLIYKGGGLQWSTNFARRTKRARKLRPNSENNFVFQALTIQHANITAETPSIRIDGVMSDDEEIAQKLTDASIFNDEKNNFSKTWKKWVFDFIGSGPTIAKVYWDNDNIGGRGPNRWVGDVAVERVDKWDMYFDAAITDLEEDLQKASYCIYRPRKKIEWIRSRWPEKGKLVTQQENEDNLINEGSNSRQTYLYEYWHRGFPWYVPEDRRNELLEKADMLEVEGDVFKARDYRDSATGELEGIHVAYYCDGVLLEYRPYEYEHGEYPFVFTTRYYDEKNPWGFGEIRNIKIPQIMHNKADEIEIEAMSRQGLGGKMYQTGAVSPKQLDRCLENAGKGGTWDEVDNLNLIKEKEGVQVPASVSNYKEHKQRMIETISNNTPIMQGQSPSSNMPWRAINELGARSDVRMNQISNKLEDFLKKINKIRLELFAQFYTEERYYRIRGNDEVVTEGTLRADEMKRSWAREDGIEEIFVPEYDVKVTVVSEKPNDRNYYTNLAMELYQLQLLTPEDLLGTLENGKLPPMEEILEKVYATQPVLNIMNQVQEMHPELQQVVMQEISKIVESTLQASQQTIQ